MLKLFFLTLFLICTLAYAIWPHKTASCIELKNVNFYNSQTHSFSLQKSDILLKEKKIAAILPTRNQYDSECLQINLENKFVLPGLIDAHTHLLAYDSQRVSNWKQALELSARRPDMMRIFMGEKNAKSMLLHGFTTVRDLGNSGNFLDVALKKRIETSIAVGPNMLVSGPGFAVYPSQINLKFNKNEYTLLDSESDISSLLQIYKDQKVDWLKLYTDNSILDQKVDASPLQNFAALAKQQGFKLAVHAEYQSSVKSALSINADSIEHFLSIPENLNLEDLKKPYIVITDFSLKSCQAQQIVNSCELEMKRLKDRIIWLKQNHFKIAFGSDAVLDFSSKFKSRGEASLASLLSWSELGFSAEEALQAATSTNAEMLQLNSGKIEVGAEASIVAYDKDPSLDLNNIKEPILVIKNSHLICKNKSECRE